MPVMDEFKKEREALKNASLKQRFSYFWLYYKWHVIVGVIAVAILTNLIWGIATRKETAFYGVFVNVLPLEGSEEYIQGYADYAGIAAEEYEVIIDNSLYYAENSMDESTMSTIQKLSVYVAAAEIDVMVSDPDVIRRYVNNETFADLKGILTEQQLEKYGPYLYYVDLKTINDINEHIIDESFTPVYPDPRKPEEMAQPVPVGIYVSDCRELRSRYMFMDEDVIMGIVVNSGRLDNAIKFLDYLFEGHID